MVARIYAQNQIGMSDFKVSPIKALASAAGRPVAVTAHGEPRAYVVPPELWEKVLAVVTLADPELAQRLN